MILYTTLRLLKNADACIDGYTKLRKSLGKGWRLDKQISLTHILESNGIDDALIDKYGPRKEDAAQKEKDVAEKLLHKGAQKLWLLKRKEGL